MGNELAALADRHPALAAWAEGLRARGHVRRVTASAPEALALVRDLGVAVDALPADGESMARFSARVLHRAHALDAGTALGGLAASAAEAIGKAVAADGAAAGVVTSRPGSAAWRREAWASVGVLVDDLSSTVLAIGLPGATAAAQGATARALAALTSSGEPAVLTLRQVVADDLGAVPPIVYVCENPAVVSAAGDLLGARSAPLVCLQGQPGAAAVTLLRRLHEGGATLRYHGDFDWGGVTIARTLGSHVAWTPWRFAAADYLAAIERRGRIWRGREWRRRRALARATSGTPSPCSLERPLRWMSETKRLAAASLVAHEFEELRGRHHGHTDARSGREVSEVAGDQAHGLAGDGHLEERFITRVWESRDQRVGRHLDAFGDDLIDERLDRRQLEAELRSRKHLRVFRDDARVDA